MTEIDLQKQPAYLLPLYQPFVSTPSPMIDLVLFGGGVFHEIGTGRIIATALGRLKS